MRFESNPILNCVRLQYVTATKHLTGEFLDQKAKEEAQIRIKIALPSDKGEFTKCYLMTEYVGYNVPETTCSKAFPGLKWMEEFILSEQE